MDIQKAGQRDKPLPAGRPESGLVEEAKHRQIIHHLVHLQQAGLGAAQQLKGCQLRRLLLGRIAAQYAVKAAAVDRLEPLRVPQRLRVQGQAHRGRRRSWRRGQASPGRALRLKFPVILPGKQAQAAD